MKQKYKLTVADTEINVVTDESKEDIDTVVGVVDRHLREIHLHSRNCSKTEAALLVALDYCAEKLKLRRKLKAADNEINRLLVLNEAAAKENASLTRELEALRKNLDLEEITPPAKTRISTPVQLSIEESRKDEEPYSPLEPDETDEIAAKSEKGAKKQNKVRSMFDYITFDDI